MYKFFKRLFDLILSIVALPFLLIITIFVGIAIKCEDGGPVFYCGKRIGRNGKIFRMVKFRSMRVNAPDIRLRDGSTYNGDDDPRVTKVGKFLRVTSIDELPQIFNVFVGQMSLIGPRPDPEDWLDKYSEEERVFLTVRPGITGYSQAYFRNQADGKEKIKNDVYYAKHCSFELDIKIFFKTIAVVVKRENTYKDTQGEDEVMHEIENMNLLDNDTQGEIGFVQEYGSEFDDLSNNQFLLKTPTTPYFLQGKNAQFFRSGRDCLKAIAKHFDKAQKVVLMPALSCPSMLLPFTSNGYHPIFYKLNEDYTANVADVESKIHDGIIFLYFSYFGVQPFSTQWLQMNKTKYPNTIFVEDCTQDLLSPREGFVADVTVASIRKWLSIPDGGVLWSKNTIKNEVLVDNSFARLRQEAMSLKSQYLRTKDKASKDKFRALLNEASNLLDVSEQPYNISLKSLDILNLVDFDQIYAVRKANVNKLQRRLDGLREQRKIKYVANDTSKSTLYFPILIENRDQVQSNLARQGVYCPVIWPIAPQAEGMCEVAQNTANKILAIPCDQRYNEQDMDYVASIVISTIQGK